MRLPGPCRGHTRAEPAGTVGFPNPTRPCGSSGREFRLSEGSCARLALGTRLSLRPALPTLTGKASCTGCRGHPRPWGPGAWVLPPSTCARQAPEGGCSTLSAWARRPAPRPAAEPNPSVT